MSGEKDLEITNEKTPLSGTIAISIGENGTANASSGSYPIQNNTGRAVPITLNGSLILNVNNGETGYISPNDPNQVCRYKVTGIVMKKVLVLRLPLWRDVYIYLPVPIVTEDVAHGPGDSMPVRRLNPDGILSPT